MKKLLIVLVGLTALVALPAGCDSRNTVRKTTAPQEDRCEEYIENSLEMLQPERLGISSEPEAVIGVLGQWSQQCAGSADTSLSEAAGTEMHRLTGDLLAGSDPATLTGRDFSLRDVSHIRDCLLFRDVAGAALREASSDLGRSVEVFNYVVRNIALIPPEIESIPLTSFEILLLGRGTTEDRAWIFADLLRQLRIDVVILAPSAPASAEADSPAPSATPHWLVGVCLDGGVYLFDPRMGLPVPSPDDDGNTVLVGRPATLEEVLKNDDIFRRLDIDDQTRYPLTSEDLRDPQVRVVGNAALWAPRMRRLQSALSGEAVIIYDPLVDTELGPGLVARAADAGRWNTGEISAWKHPEQAYRNALAPGERQAMVRAGLFQIFDAPLRLPKQRPPVGPEADEQALQEMIEQMAYPSREQLTARTRHMIGDFEKVIADYQRLRLEMNQLINNPLMPDRLRALHAVAAEDDFFWTGLCQHELGEYAAAADTLQKYINSFGGRGRWALQASFLNSLSRAEAGQFAVALQNLSGALESPAVDPLQKHGYALLVDRWRNLRDASRREESQ